MGDSRDAHTLEVILNEINDAVSPDSYTPKVPVAAQFPATGCRGLLARSSILGTIRAKSWSLRFSNSFLADGLISTT